MTSDSSLALLMRILRGELPASPPDEAAWTDLLQTARRQTVAGLLYQAAERFPENYRMPENVLFTLLAEVKKIVTNNLKLAAAEKEALGILRSGSLEPVVMKGSSCAARYTKPELRTGGDIDLYVPEADFLRAAALFRDAGWEGSEKPDSSMDFIIGGCEVELHRRYFDLHISEKLLPDVGSSEAELLMLSSHILKHACGVGVGLRQIIDFALAYKAYPGDYQALHQLFRQCGLHRWHLLLLSFVKDYIDPGTEVAEKVDSAALFRIVARGGNFGHFSGSRLESIQQQGAFRRKMDTLRRILSNLNFSLRYAPREVFPFLVELFQENLH
ncbi:MAG: nucleotidyltransferase family protein [Bacteroidales bacterium]|nr:nucleotidyltransferase family protein [Bacteroidales bacterium]